MVKIMLQTCASNGYSSMLKKQLKLVVYTLARLSSFSTPLYRWLLYSSWGGLGKMLPFRWIVSTDFSSY